MPDGYSDIEEVINDQIKINTELIKASKELNDIPDMPKNLDKWIDSLPNEKTKFKLVDYSNLFKIGRKYNKLVERQKSNAQKLKVIMIDDLLKKIKDVLGK